MTPTHYGTPFARTLDAALVAAGWQSRPLGAAWSHDESGLSVGLLTGRTVRLRREGRDGQTLVRSRLHDPDCAALDVAAQLVAIARSLVSVRPQAAAPTTP